MASEISGLLQMSWSFTIREIFYPRSHDDKALVVLVGTISSGGLDDPIGRLVRVFIAGRESGQGRVVSRFRFENSLSDQSAYVYEGTPINREDICNDIIIITK
jgi:hypothetical protein